MNQPPFLFRRDGRLCRIEEDDTGRPVPITVDVNRMNFLLVTLLDWTTKNRKGEVISARPPKDLASHLVSDPDPRVPVLQRIVTAPILASDGQPLIKPQDYSDGNLYLPPISFRLRELPRCPSEEDVESAVDFIRKNLFGDFLFVGVSELANAFAALLTPFVREVIDGPTPLFWVDKSKGGTGGTLYHKRSLSLSWALYRRASPPPVTNQSGIA